jgi:hypothetical protein
MIRSRLEKWLEIERLPSKRKALSSSSSTKKRKEREMIRLNQLLLNLQNLLFDLTITSGLIWVKKIFNSQVEKRESVRLIWCHQPLNPCLHLGSCSGRSSFDFKICLESGIL